jgi:hypothetical protein
MASPAEAPPRLVLLLGAGASAEAGVPTTVHFVDEFLKAHSEDAALEDMVSKMRKNDPGTDVEALLRVLNVLSQRETMPESLFLEPVKGLASTQQLARWRDLLELFIRQRCFVPSSKVSYLEPLRQLVANYQGPLDVFTVNYDTSIEVFCLTRDIRFSNGFRGSWQPEIFKEEEAGLRLYKIHGSVTWWSTDQGIIVEIPVKIENPETQLYYGAKARTLNIYPYEATKGVPSPAVDLLPLLREKLLSADLLVSVGYSFRDAEIRTIVLDALRVNKGLALVLIGPSAYPIFEEKLRFASSGVESSAVDRTALLPFMFQDAFPRLQDEHLHNLLYGLKQYQDMLGSEIKWGQLSSPGQYGYACVALARGGLWELAWKLLRQKFPLGWPLEQHLKSVMIVATFSILGNAKGITDELGDQFNALKQRLQHSAKVGADQSRFQLTFVSSGVGEGSVTENNVSAFGDWVDELRFAIERYAMASRDGVEMLKNDPHLRNLHDGLQAIQTYLLSTWTPTTPKGEEEHLARWTGKGLDFSKLDRSKGLPTLLRQVLVEHGAQVSQAEGQEIAGRLFW